MDRNNRDARRATTVSTSVTPPLLNGLPRRRHRTSLRDSLEEDGPLELPDTSKSGLRDRHVGGKKDRERIDRLDRLDRDGDRDRERSLRNKRRRGDGDNNHRLIHHSGPGNRAEELGIVADESSEESVNDNEDDGNDDHHHQPQHTTAVPSSVSMMLNNSRRSYPPAASVMAAAAGTTLKVVRPAWKVADEMIGVSVPRRARSASAKRSHDCWVGGGVTASHASGASGDQASRQLSTSPVRPGLAITSPVNNRPASPSSSNASARKKPKLNGPKQRPPNSVSSSATQDEIEIAEVLFGMMRQPQGPSSKNGMSFGGEFVESEVSPDENNKTLSNTGSVLPPQNSSSSIPLMSAVAPKRKKPRAIKYDEEIHVQSMYLVRNSPIRAKIEMYSVEKGRGPVMENGSTYEPGKPQDTPVSLVDRGEDASKMEGLLGSNKREESLVGDSKEEFLSLKKESGTLQLDGDLHVEGKIDLKRSGDHEVENHGEKYQIDLMTPPSTRLSPGRDGDGDFAAGTDQMSIASNGKATGLKEKNVGDEEVKRETEGEGRKSGGGDGKGVGLEMGGDGGGMMMGNASSSSGSGSKGNPPQPKQQQLVADKSAPSAGPLTFPVPVAGWPGGLPPMSYMPGIVAMDGSTVASAALPPPQLLFSQPRPKRCTTHCYIARNISCQQQMARIPFWPAAAGSVPLYGAKPCNVNVIPSSDLIGNASTRSGNAVADKGRNLGQFACHSGKDKVSQTTSGLEAQRKPVLLQQAIPPGNILHGPAFIFPPADSASIRSGSSKSPNTSNTGSTPGAAVGSASAVTAATGAASAMGFSYPNIPGGETQYLAILQNNSYPIPVPAHVGAAPVYRGTHPQAIPFYNGPFYSSQILHPSQLPQQVPANLQQMQQGQGHQNASISSASSTSLKHLPNHQPRPLGSGSNGSLQQGFPSGKYQPLPQTPALQQQFNQSQLHQVPPLESEVTGEDSPSTAETRIPRANLTTIYGQNFAMPIHTPNFSLMTRAPLDGPNCSNSNNPGEKQKPQLTSQHQGWKMSAIDSLQSQAFALSFGNMGNSASAQALDISSNTQGHTIVQSLPEATRQTYQITTAAASAQNAHAQQKNIRVSNDGKGPGNDASNDDDRKHLGGKSSATVGQSIAFSRTDPMDASVSSLPGSSVVDNSIRTLNLGSVSSRGSSSAMPALVSPTIGALSPQQLQRSQHQQMIQLHKQNQFAAAATARSKTPTTSNGSIYSEHLGASASPASKYSSLPSSYPPNVIPGSGSQTHLPQWRGSTRPATSPISSVSPATATSPSLKLLSQQPVRVLPGQTHISFANSNTKSSSASQGLQIPAGNQQTPSSPVVLGSPTTSSVSKSTGGSPRTTTSSTGNKPVQTASLLQAPRVKNSSESMPMHKSSTVGSGSVLSILGNPPLMASSATGTIHQLPQQHQQLSKQNLQQAQLFFSHPYIPVLPAHSTTSSASTVSATSAYYMQRCPSEQRPKVQQLPQGSASSSSSSAMLSLCHPVSVATSGSGDPVKAVTIRNIKGSNLQSQSIIHASQFAVAQASGSSHKIVPTGFSYVHTIPNAVEVKKAEQKPAAGE